MEKLALVSLPNGIACTRFMASCMALFHPEMNTHLAASFGNDTKASFSIYFQQMMKVDADEIKAGMQ